MHVIMHYDNIKYDTSQCTLLYTCLLTVLRAL